MKVRIKDIEKLKKNIIQSKKLMIDFEKKEVSIYNEKCKCDYDVLMKKFHTLNVNYLRYLWEQLEEIIELIDLDEE